MDNFSLPSNNHGTPSSNHEEGFEAETVYQNQGLMEIEGTDTHHSGEERED
jgi:hypothetical protein